MYDFTFFYFGEIIMVNIVLFVIPGFLLVLGILEIAFAERFARFYVSTIKYEKRPTVKPMPKSHYTPSLVRGIGIAMVVFAIILVLLLLFSGN